MSENNTRKKQARETKERLLNCIKKLLYTNTIENIQIKDICNAAGVSTGAFYHHFPSKSQIIIELYKEIDELFEKEIYPKYKDLPTREAIIGYITEQVKHALKYDNHIIESVYKAQIDTGNDFFLSMDRGLPKGLFLLIEKGITLGNIKESVKAEKLSEELLIISRGIIYHWCVSDGKSDMIGEVNTIIGTYLDSYLN